MTGGPIFEPSITGEQVKRWDTQKQQMRSASTDLAAAPTTGLPSAAKGAASTFLDMWQNAAREASVAAEVYAEELEATKTSYLDFDAEIARRMKELEAK